MASMMSSFLCRLFGHYRLRTKIWHDGLDYRAPCRRCGLPLIRDLHGDWRPFDAARDAPPGSHHRSSHPHHEH